MAVLSFPALVPAAATWHLQANTATFASPLTRATQTLELAGARWMGDFNFPPLLPAQWRQLQAFVARMRGQAGRAYVTPPQYQGPATGWTVNASALTCDSTAVKCDSTLIGCNQTDEAPWGTPVVTGANQAGGNLSTSGWVAEADVLAAGDYLSYDTSVGRSLHMVLDAARSDSFGRVTLAIEPPIRVAPASGAALEIEAPTCIMRLGDNDTGAAGFSPGGSGPLGQVSLALVEAF